MQHVQPQPGMLIGMAPGFPMVQGMPVAQPVAQNDAENGVVFEEGARVWSFCVTLMAVMHIALVVLTWTTNTVPKYNKDDGTVETHGKEFSISAILSSNLMIPTVIAVSWILANAYTTVTSHPMFRVRDDKAKAKNAQAGNVTVRAWVITVWTHNPVWNGANFSLAMVLIGIVLASIATSNSNTTCKKDNLEHFDKDADIGLLQKKVCAMSCYVVRNYDQPFGGNAATLFNPATTTYILSACVLLFTWFAMPVSFRGMLTGRFGKKADAEGLSQGAGGGANKPKRGFSMLLPKARSSPQPAVSSTKPAVASTQPAGQKSAAQKPATQLSNSKRPKEMNPSTAPGQARTGSVSRKSSVSTANPGTPVKRSKVKGSPV